MSAEMVDYPHITDAAAAFDWDSVTLRELVTAPARSDTGETAIPRGGAGSMHDVVDQEEVVRQSSAMTFSLCQDRDSVWLLRWMIPTSGSRNH